MHVGFSGTQNGMTDRQSEQVEEILKSIQLNQLDEGGDSDLVLHHGDCIGADEDVHLMLRQPWSSYLITIHPPLDAKKRAHMKGDKTFPTHGYLERNRMIVLSSNVLLAAPASEEVLRSGTWATIRYARERKTPITIVMPDGSVMHEPEEDT